MVCLLIEYPALFACKSKFERKVNRIISRLTEFEVVYQADPQGFITTLFANDARVTTVRMVDNLSDVQISHAVIFDGGDTHADLLQWLRASEVVVRVIAVKITTVINLKRHPEYKGLKSTTDYVYIGRGAYWGNPYSMFEEGESRDEVIRKYRYDFEQDKFLNIDPKRVHELAGKKLGCFCSPEPCHGDVLADYLNAFDDGL